MRSFFNKPAWAASGGGDPKTEFYRRSEHTYSDIVAANREAYKKPKVSPDGPANPHVEGDRHSKRPRLSEETEDKDELNDPSPPPTEEVGPRKEGALTDGHIESEKASPKAKGNHSPRSPSNRPSSGRKLHKSLADRLERSQSSESTPSPSVKGAITKSDRHDAGPENTLHISPPPTAPPSTSSPAPPVKVDDPTVQILLTSDIPNTKPLIVHRKMSQALREVRLEWCRRQGFPEATQPSVYLTWKGRRLFDVTTCRSLGIKTGSSTLLSSMDDDLVAGPRELHIHMVAVTDNRQLLDQPKTHQDTGSASPAPHNPENEENAPMKLILRSPGRDDFKIKARPKTLVSKLISAFRSNFSIAVTQEVSLWFDGDRLDPDTSLQDYDMADLDLVDVQVK